MTGLSPAYLRLLKLYGFDENTAGGIAPDLAALEEELHDIEIRATQHLAISIRRYVHEGVVLMVKFANRWEMKASCSVDTAAGEYRMWTVEVRDTSHPDYFLDGPHVIKERPVTLGRVLQIVDETDRRKKGEPL